jgi:flavin-binding protein dodecin
MAKKNEREDSVYKVVEVIGTSTKSWEEAARVAVKTAAGTLRNLRIAEVAKMDLKVENGKVVAYRTRLQLSFKYEN